MNKKTAIFIPFLILVYFFVHYITDLWYFLNAKDSFFTFIKYFAIILLLLFTGYKIFNRKQQFLGAFTSILFLFLFYGSFIDTGVSLKLLTPVNHIDLKMMLVFVVICFLIGIICFRLKENSSTILLRFWLIYCLALLLYDGGVFIIAKKQEKKYLANASPEIKISAIEKPPVFFLLFDMYPSDTVLKKYLHFDNSTISGFLKQQNFFVSGDASSLYDETYNSLASTLNLRSLYYYNDSGISDYKKPLIALKNIENASLPKLFEQHGYVFRNYSVFNIAGNKSPLQFNLNYHLDNALTASTFFNRWYDAFEADFLLANRKVDFGFLKRSWSDAVANDIIFLDTTFKNSVKSFPEEQPSFNYFHFMIPHPPILFDSTGKKMAVSDMYAFNGFENANSNFTAYIQYGNKWLQKMVKMIFDEVGPNVVIIIQGDHGYREFIDQFPDEMRFGAYNAVYLPGKNYEGFTDSISVLSTFKQVLKNQFEYNMVTPH